MRYKVLATIAAIIFFAAYDICGQNYASMFDDAMDAKIKNSTQIDSILTAWEVASPQDTDLAIAKFRRVLLERYKPVITKTKDKEADNDTTYLITIDHVLDTDVIKKAYSIIDKAIDENPDLYILRLKKLYYTYKMDFYDDFIKYFDEAFQQQLRNNGQWIVDDTYHPTVPRDEILLMLVVGYMNDILGQNKIDIDFAERLLDTGLKYFPEDFRLLNLYGVLEGNYRYDTKAAIDYYNRALVNSPGDIIVLLNLAHMQVRIGDSEGAIKNAKTVIYSPDAPAEYVEEAKDIVRQAKSERIPVSLYSFEFQFVPMLAENATSLFQLTNVDAILEDLLPSEGYAPSFNSKIVSDSLLSIGDKECVVWTFDDPAEIPLCKYIVFIPVNDKIEVYTLEKTLPLNENVNWVIGRPTTEGHASVGGAKGFENGEEFAKYVLEKFVN